MARKFGSGEPVRIADFEHASWQDAGEAHKRARQGLDPMQSFLHPDSQEGIILVKNTTPLELPQYAVLGIRGTIPNPRGGAQQLAEYKNNPALKGEVPTTTTIGRFCVLQAHAYKGEVVPAMVSGVTPVRLNIESLADEFAEIDPTVTDPTKFLKTGSSGSAQIIDRPEVTGEQWGIVRLGNRPVETETLIRFELTGAIALGANAPAKLMQPSAIGTGIWEAVTPQVDIRVYDSYDPDGMWAAPSGSWGWAFPREQEYSTDVAAYDIVWMERAAQLIRFTATQYMGQGTDWQLQSTSVDWYDWQGIDPGSTITIHDPNHSWQDVPTGAQGVAYYNNKDSRYEVLHADRVVQEGRATLNGALCAETSMVAITWVEGIVNGEFQIEPDTLPTTAINPRKHAGLSGDTVTLRRINNNMPNPDWEIVDVDKHLIEYVTDVELDGLDLKQTKREGYMEICTVDETVTTIATGTEECP